MWRRRTSLTSGNSRPSGYTIVELLVALAVASTVGLLAVSSYVYVTREWMGQGQRLSTQQSLRDAIDMVTREIRLAGSCLPSAGPVNIRALDGTDSGMADTITVRANVVCAIGTVQSFSPTQITLDTVENFAAGMWAYILSADTTSGEYFRVLSTRFRN